MLVSFVKYEGAGNDFILIDDREELFSADARLIADLCDRHFGIGADGLMTLQRSVEMDCSMRYYNADGSPGEMCGNGGRCFALFAHHLGIGGDIKRFDSTDGIHEARMLRIDGLRSTVELGMIDVERIDRGDGYWFLDTGVPHYVEFTDDLEAVDVIGRGRRIRYDKRFAKGTNVNFVKVVGPGHIAVRTYERGVEDETLACGTGSTAAALVTHLAAQPSVTAFRIDVRGGRLGIAFDEPKPGIYTRIRLSGEARKVFEGSYDTANFQS
ncbi:diaminopimelate epimerase [Alistipes putredinis]|uniref:diaminopimelate epimerase n=1 Tax=Alistipes putredinis TaxID=28117 RepID=UPI00242AE368|nr:diaminopimelate epimerase [Alistipes putredinis]